MDRTKSGNGWLALFSLVWIGVAAAGMTALWRFTATPGSAGHATDWPSGSSLQRSESQPTLLVFVHPECSCSEVTLEELDRLLGHATRLPSVTVEFVRPKGTPRDWEQTALWRKARGMVHVSVGVDVDGREAELFGAETSGQALLYASSGRLLFAGGITAGRSHAGDNAGEDAILALLDRGSADRASTPVFGCALQTPEVR